MNAARHMPYPMWRRLHRLFIVVNLIECMSRGIYAQPISSQSLVPDMPASPENLLAQAAAQVGVKRCLSAVNQVSSRALTGTIKHDIVIDWDHLRPDQGPLFSLTGLEFNGASALLSLSTAPMQGGNCAILVERVSSAATPCRNVANSELRGYRATALVRSVTVYTTPARPTETVTLVETPPSCLILRRQVDYSWPGSP
ncbi:hypothetical protein G3O06_13775 [Burkholderia sp. Ac-20345]|uniref:hypothetical protein n=1 Tax=Burkholderia sp. Ac-20345 TaxID=2703891 RepID=UPI00197B888A|nr:hypothetical protein [Burkholderia sp. Ac-20345]MBN3778615.1 hypothetical protein [Burkholderia sp. Ac-20345]